VADLRADSGATTHDAPDPVSGVARGSAAGASWRRLSLPARRDRAHGPSLRRQLLRPLVWSWLAGLACALTGAWIIADASANRAFDLGLMDQATALGSRVNWSDRGPLLDMTPQAMEAPSWDAGLRNAYVMVDFDGNAMAGDARVPVPPARLRNESQFQPRLFDAVFEGRPVRGAVFTVLSPMLDRRVALIVVETKGRRAELKRDLQLTIVLPTAVLGLLTMGLLAWATRRGLRPLRDLATEVARRDAHDLRPLPMDQVPAEAVPLIERLNGLLGDLEESLHLQRRFVADAAHQLRTPVAGMRVLAQTLEQDLQTPDVRARAERMKPAVEQLVRTSDRLGRLISQLLSLARSESALSPSAERESLELVAHLRELAEPLALQAMKEGKELALDAPDGPVRVQSNGLWLGEVALNLLDNALRYGGAHLTLRVRSGEAGGAVIEVEDDGAGVDEAQRLRMFEPFWRGERADLRNDGGTGLGLAIAREIVQRLGGRLTAEPRQPGPGLIMRIELSAG